MTNRLALWWYWAAPWKTWQQWRAERAYKRALPTIRARDQLGAEAEMWLAHPEPTVNGPFGDFEVRPKPEG